MVFSLKIQKIRKQTCQYWYNLARTKDIIEPANHTENVSMIGWFYGVSNTVKYIHTIQMHLKIFFDHLTKQDFNISISSLLWYWQQPSGVYSLLCAVLLCQTLVASVEMIIPNTDMLVVKMTGHTITMLKSAADSDSMTLNMDTPMEVLVIYCIKMWK